MGHVAQNYTLIKFQFKSSLDFLSTLLIYIYIYIEREREREREDL